MTEKTRMNMRNKTLMVVLALVVSVGAIGALSFTTATVERSANINVETDPNGFIGLQPGVDSGTPDDIFLNGTDVIQFDLDESDRPSNALNPEAVYEYGNNADGGSGDITAAAFTVTNNDAELRDITVTYTLDSGTDPSTVDNVRFLFYDGGTITTEQELNEGGSLTLGGVAPDATYEVVIIVNTNELSSADDLSGTLTFTAE